MRAARGGDPMSTAGDIALARSLAAASRPAGSLVADYGLRGCPRGEVCRGGCVKATERNDPRHQGFKLVVPSPECELMGGPRPTPGRMP